MLLSALVAILAQTTLYVSESGSDSNSGRSQSQAFRTLARVQQELKKGGVSTVELRGAFMLEKTLELGPEANGVTFRGVGATISGGREIKGWQADRFAGKSVWSASVAPGNYFKQLFVTRGSERAPRTRLPDTGVFQFTGLTKGAEKLEWNKPQDEAIFRQGDIRNWRNLEDVEVIATHFWVESHLPIKNVDEQRRLVRFQNPSVFRLTEEHTGRAAPYWIENVPELRKPGQWYLDRRDWKVYYWPRGSERLESFTAVAPGLPTLVHLKGAKGVTFSGIQFRHTEYKLPKGYPGDMQAAWSIPGAIYLEETQNCVVEDCRFGPIGTYAIELKGPNSTGNTIRKTVMKDLGAGGVKIGYGTTKTTLTDSVIEEGGRIYLSAVGIWLADSPDNLISHNRIRDLYYTGISVGWTWGYGPSKATGNIVEFNEISDLGHGRLSDMGGIYTLGVSPGTILRNNHIYNIDSHGYGGWGIYLDEGSSGILIENNVVHDTKTGGFHQHYGRDNTVRNNIFAFARAIGQVILSRYETGNNYTFERNVVAWEGTDLFGGAQGKHPAIYKNNLFWRYDRGPIQGWGQPIAEIGSGNVVAQPQFVNPTARDLRLEASSPAFRLGFNPISLSRVGPRR